MEVISNRRWWLLTFFLLGMVCELSIPYANGWWLAPNGEEPEIAKHLYRWEGFLSPLDSSPDAPVSSWSPPVYPAILSVFYHLFGDSGRYLLAALAVFNSMIFGIVTAGLFYLAQLLWRSRWPGVIAGLIHCGLPVFVHTACDFWDVYVALAIFLWLLIAAVKLRQRPTTLWHAAGLGLGLALLSMTNAAYALAYPVIVWMAAKLNRRGCIPFSATTLGCFVLALLPWTIRNYHQFGRVFYMRQGLGLEIWLYNMPGRTGAFDHDARYSHPTHNRDEREMLLQMGETKYFQYCWERFKADYTSNPDAYWRRTLRRVLFCLTSNPTLREFHHKPSLRQLAWISIVENPANACLTLVGLLGIGAALFLRRPGSWVFLCGVLAIMPYLFVAVYPRYLAPFRLMLALFAAMFLAEMISLVRRLNKT